MTLKGDFEKNLNQILELEKPKSILVITGNKSFKNSKAEDYFKKLKSNYLTYLYSKSNSIVSFDEVSSFLNKTKYFDFDLIVTYGGGSVIDFAKIISLFKRNTDEFSEYFFQCHNLRNIIITVAVPTTSGSGAESTHFAVLYKDEVKYSISNKFIKPKYVILDSSTTLSLGKNQIACSGIDAICQSIESLWANNKTNLSERYAIQSIELIYPNLIKVFNGDDRKRFELMKGSNLSGKAINISKTTGPHALSYYLTLFHNIPHGEAVAINFEKFLYINFKYVKKEYQHKIFDVFKIDTLNELISEFSNLKKSLRLKENLSCIENLNFENYLSNINLERMNNNPVILNKKELKSLLLE